MGGGGGEKKEFLYMKKKEIKCFRGAVWGGVDGRGGERADGREVLGWWWWVDNQRKAKALETVR